MNKPIMAVCCNQCRVLQPVAERCSHCGSKDFTYIHYPNDWRDGEVPSAAAREEEK